MKQWFMKHWRFVITSLVLIVFAALMILPIYWQILISVRETDAINQVPAPWFFTEITFDHFRRVFERVRVMRYLWNTIVITGLVIITNLTFGSLAAYAFAKLRFRFRDGIFKVLLLSLMIPGVVTMLPAYLVILRFPFAGGNNLFGQGGSGFLNSYAGIILPGAITVFSVFFLRQFFKTIPDDIGEAARIDGASEFRVFASVYLPLVKPALITLTIFTFQGAWNAFLWPNIILTPGSERSPLTVALQQFVAENPVAYGPMMAISLIMSIFPFILFIIAQRYFMRSVVTTMR